MQMPVLCRLKDIVKQLFALIIKTPYFLKVNEVFGAKENLDFEDLKKLQYLEQCIKETLRIHPPVIVFFRKNHHSSETVSNVSIPKGNFY